MNPYIKVSESSKSWHIISTWTRVPGRAVTLCRRRVDGPTTDDFGDDRTCELCWRAKARREAATA